MIEMKAANAPLRLLLNIVDAWAITLPPWGIYALPLVFADFDKCDRMERHENVHWQQYQRMGAVRYYLAYAWQWLRYGYQDMPMEIEAREAE